MGEYIPITIVIRHAVTYPRERLGEPRPIKGEAFDAWLAEERRQAAEEAWEEGYYSGMEYGRGFNRDNPYREERQVE